MDYKVKYAGSGRGVAVGTCGPLTDAKIAKYYKQGWYSQEFKSLRKELMARKRSGNFIEYDGRLIYSPKGGW